MLFCGINPGLYTAAAGHNFARPGNRFWPIIHRAGFTPRQLRPDEERELLRYGCGITNIVARATATASELSDEELRAGAKVLRRKVLRFQPRVLAVVGIAAYRTAFEKTQAPLGRQEEGVASTVVWILPNPSGLNAHYRPPELARLYGELREWLRRKR